VLTCEEWLPFVDEWKAVLDEHPKIEYFKTKEARSCTRQFARVTTTQRDRKVQRLLSVILNHRPTTLLSAIPYDAYEEAFKGRIAKGTDYPYFLAYYEVIGVWLRYQYFNGPPNQKVNFVFDEQMKEGDFAQSAWNFGANNMPKAVKSFLGDRPTHRDEKTFLPLQAADMLAWHTRRYYAERSHGREFNDPVWKALRSLPCAEGEMSRERLVKIANGVKASGLVFEYDVPPRLRKMLKRVLAEEKAERSKQQEE
jgi:hypothetical protein